MFVLRFISGNKQCFSSLPTLYNSVIGNTFVVMLLFFDVYAT